MRTPFTLEEHNAHPDWKVETRNGRPVRIICIDAKGYAPVIALITNDDGVEVTMEYHADGRWSNTSDDDHDLFFATPEPELTELENAVQNIMRFARDGKYDPEFEKSVFEASQELLDLARKEILNDLPRWKKCEYKGTFIDATKIVLHDGYYIELEDLEQLPKED